MIQFKEAPNRRPEPLNQNSERVQAPAHRRSARALQLRRGTVLDFRVPSDEPGVVQPLLRIIKQVQAGFAADQVHHAADLRGYCLSACEEHHA